MKFSKDNQTITTITHTDQKQTNKWTCGKIDRLDRENFPTQIFFLSVSPPTNPKNTEKGRKVRKLLFFILRESFFSFSISTWWLKVFFCLSCGGSFLCVVIVHRISHMFVTVVTSYVVVADCCIIVSPPGNVLDR